MFNFKKISILICTLFYLIALNTVSSYDRFAKVVIIGDRGSGKTTLYKLLTDSNKKVSHSRQISNERLSWNITDRVWRPNHGIKSWFSKGKFVNEEKSVGVYIFDTSGEEEHAELMQQFCKGAHVVVVTLDAYELVRSRFIDKRYFALQSLSELVDNIYDYAPGCKVFVVLTKSKKARDRYGKACNQILNLDNLKNAISGTFPKLQVNKIYEYDPYYFGYHKSNIEDIIKNSLRNYGLDNLPTTSDGLRAEITKKYAGQKTVYYEEHFFFGLFSTTKSYQTDNYVPALNWH